MLKALTPLAWGSISVVGSEHSGFLCAFLKGAFKEGTEDPLFAHMGLLTWLAGWWDCGSGPGALTSLNVCLSMGFTFVTAQWLGSQGE